MKKIILNTALLLLLSSCMVSQSDYDKLKSENSELKTEERRLKSENKIMDAKLDSVEIQNERIEQKKFEISLHTEEEALKLIEDYYSFYNANTAYRNPQLRRVADNIFKVSLEECANKESFKDSEFFWNSRVLTLEINNNGSYEVK